MVRPKSDAELIALDRHLSRLRRRVDRIHRGMKQGTAQWTAWSATLDEAQALVGRIHRIPAEGLSGLAIKVGAIVRFLEETDAVLDLKGLRQLRALALDDTAWHNGSWRSLPDRVRLWPFICLECGNPRSYVDVAEVRASPTLPSYDANHTTRLRSSGGLRGTRIA